MLDISVGQFHSTESGNILDENSNEYYGIKSSNSELSLKQD